MTGKPFSVIDVIDLSHVVGGLDKRSAAVKRAVDQALIGMQDVVRATAPKDDPLMAAVSMMSGRKNHRRSGSGPTPAPALPPTSTLTR